MKKKIVNIHTDRIFLNLYSKILPSHKFENHSIFLGTESIDDLKPAENLYHFNQDKDGIREVLSICKTANIVVLHNLDLFKSIIANRVDEDLIIIWRFFGQELYSKLPHEVYSEKTRKYLEKKYMLPYGALIKSYLKMFGSLKSIIKYRVIPKKEEIKAFKRINYFACSSKAEYHFLSKHFPDLPEFMQIPFLNSDIKTVKASDKELNILLGNNSSKYNNHLDLIVLINNTKVYPPIRFILLFNYGIQKKYSRMVLQKASDVKNLEIITDFLPPEAFIQLYKRSSALVINGYRQMGLGNIFLALQLKVKVYLNRKNFMYKWFLEEGFHIFDIEQLRDDLETGNILLDERLGTENQMNYVKLSNKYSVEKFNKFLLNLT